jgi:hypothetical protein
MAAIDSFDQWRLLVGVCPLFERELPWTPRTRQEVDESVVADNARFMKVYFGTLKVLVPPEAMILAERCDAVEWEINSLLSTLERLLQDSIKDSTEIPRDMGAAEVSQPSKFLPLTHSAAWLLTSILS